jgi:hypothetical protein
VVVAGPTTVAELVPEVDTEVTILVVTAGMTVVPVAGLALPVLPAVEAVRLTEGVCPDVKVRDWPAASVAPAVYEVVVKRQVWMMSRTSTHASAHPITMQ